MATYYYVKNRVFHGINDVYTKKELIKVLNNFDLHDSWYGIYITMYTGVTDIHWIDYGNYYSLSVNDDCGVYILNKDEIKHLYNQAHTWLKQQIYLEKQAVKWEQNHDSDNNPYGNRWNGQVQFLIQSNCFGNPAKLPVVKGTIHYHHLAPRSKPHSTRGNFGFGRVGHEQGTFARNNYWSRIKVNELVNEYGRVVRHRNRKYNRKHTQSFPVFDDHEYIASEHSTGWKYSTKAKHQWAQHLRPEIYPNKRKTDSS